MEKEKLLLGKILGEIYRLQKKTDESLCRETDLHIYALLNGFETAIDDELESIGFIPGQKIRHTIEVLNKYWNDPEKMENFKGFYDIENELEKGGVGRGTAIRIITYLKANHQFETLIDKMNSEHSPVECKNFDLYF